MNELRLRARQMRAWKNTTVSDPAARTERINNHLLDKRGKRAFSAEVPGTRLVGDITYLKTDSGWLYRATRLVVGWSRDSNMHTPLGVNALAMAQHDKAIFIKITRLASGYNAKAYD